MPLSSHTFWIDYESGKLLESIGSGAEATTPKFYQGDTARIELHLLRRTSNTSVLIEEIAFPSGSSVKFAIGRSEAAPSAGSFKVSYKGTSTTDLAFNATASQIATALNAIASVASEGGVSVVATGDAFLISWVSGTSHDPFVGDGDLLFPASSVALSELISGDAQKVMLHLQQSPIALTDTFTSLGTPTGSVQLLSDINSVKTYRVSISPNPAGGSFILSSINPSTSAVTGASVPISVESTSSQVLASLPSTIRTGASVIKSGAFSWDITLTASDSLGFNGSGLIGWLGLQGELSLNTAEVHQFLNGAASGDAVLEIMVQDGSGQSTLIQTTCTVIADLIDASSLVPVPGSTPMDEAVANARFVRRDTDQSPDASTINQIWRNLGVPSSGSSVSGAIASSNAPSSANPFATMADVGGGGGGSYLPLAGGTMSGAIIFDPTGGQNIAKGTFDNGSSGAYHGISLTCAVGYELNWQGGRLTNWYSGAAQAIIFDSPLNIASAGGITFSDNTSQTTAGLTPAGGALTSGGVLTFSNGTYDSEVGGWGFGVELSSDTNQSATVEYNQIIVKNSSQTMKMTPAGLTFPDNSTQSTAYVPGADGWNEFDSMTMMVDSPSAYISTGYSNIYAYFTRGSNPISHWYNNKYGTAYWGVFVNGTLMDVITYATSYYYGYSSAYYSMTTGDHVQVKLGWYDGTSYRWANKIFLMDYIY